MPRIAFLLLSVLLISACSPSGTDRPPASGTLTPEALDRHGEEFREDVIEVTDGVYVAIGFGIANSIMIEGDDAVTIVDTMEDRKSVV